MKTYGIRISDGKGDVLSSTLNDILKEIDKGFLFNWCILFLDGTPNPGQGQFLLEYKKRIDDSENGLLVSWEELKKLSEKFFQMFEITVLGCTNVHFLHRYKEETEMYKVCDIVIELIDCAFWEIHVKDEMFIEQFKIKFNKTKLLD